MKYLIFIGVLSLVSCSVELTESTSEPGYPIEGLWVQKMEAPGHTRLMAIKHGGNGKYAYSFQFMEFYPRVLSLTGRTGFITRIDGYADTSTHEVLLVQEKFRSGSYKIKETPGDVWQVDNFGRILIDREFTKFENLDLLQISSAGNELIGSEYAFKRSIPSDNPDEFTLASDLGYIIQRDQKTRELLLFSFSPVLAIANQSRNLFESGKIQKGVTIKKVYNDFMNAVYANADIASDALVVMPDFKINQKVKRTLSRAEILRRIKNGQEVSKEDLVRVLGQDSK